MSSDNYVSSFSSTVKIHFNNIFQYVCMLATCCPQSFVTYFPTKCSYGFIIFSMSAKSSMDLCAIIELPY